MRQPDGFGDGTRRVCRLQKTLYGLKQWSDPCAYIRQDGDDLEIVTVWVDDLLLFTTSDSVMRKRGDSLTISQPQYVNSILRKYKMEDANPVSTPRSNDYASLMGSLQYLAIATRPDIAYAVNRLAAYTANPSFEHYTA